jgi:hypothetical protein
VEDKQKEEGDGSGEDLFHESSYRFKLPDAFWQAVA